ncbi:DUF2637 domain-containing protein [Actinomycetota bacterium Odt1-20B]
MVPRLPRISGWDRAAIVALGGAGCALSYDALQQMATAIHIRGLLTFLFPLVIDGFIAYGVRALLVLRTAPLASRCYVWFLFGTATAASIWANALHAVRLNQQQPVGGGLRLGDLTVGVLSTLAPLALAGAVHLYILIARRVTEAALSSDVQVMDARTEQVSDDREETRLLSDGHATAPVTSRQQPNLPAPDSGCPAVTDGQDTLRAAAADTGAGRSNTLPEPEPEHAGPSTDQGGDPDLRPRRAARLHLAKLPVTAPAKKPDTGDREATPVTDEQLLAIARTAVIKVGGLTRKIVADAIRGDGHGLGNDRLTRLMEHLRKEAEEGPDTQTG